MGIKAGRGRYGLRVLNIQDVAESQMCCGCGVCAYVNPNQIRMVDTLDYGRRPLVSTGPEGPEMREAMSVCPGIGLGHSADRPGSIRELTPGWGPVLELWEGYAADPVIRYRGSSGGAATALALFAVERQGMHGVLHIAAREDVPYLNTTVLSRTRDEMMARTGSRYAPASPCDGLGLVEAAPSPCVFIGKPCDIAAAEKARSTRPALHEKLGLTIAVFCAGTPSTNGTLQMLRAMGIDDPDTVLSVRYRGNGWPGMATARFRTADGEAQQELTYEQSWGTILQKHRQWRCYVCPDHTGEFADIAVGDPWYRKIPDNDPGRSLVLVRTERGRQLLRAAMEAGYLTLTPSAADVLPASQPNLLKLRGNVWARLWVCRLLGAAAPRYERIPMFRFWLSQLNLRAKAQSIVGTAKRVFRKKLRVRRPVREFTPGSSDAIPHETAVPLREGAAAR